MHGPLNGTLTLQQCAAKMLSPFLKT